jgi:exodeoxyribonuclease V gamma subunit
MLSALSQLLDLGESRVTATEVLDFAAREPVRRRFRLDDDDLERVKQWVTSTAVRWGLHRDHRASFSLGNVEQNTWRAGIDRVLLGVTMAEQDDRMVDDVLPLDDVESGSIELAGRVAELVDRLDRAIGSLRGTKTIAEWASGLGDAAHALFGAGDRDAWQRSQLQRVLDDAVRDATAGGVASETPLELADLRALLADRLRGQPTRANFRTGHLTFCTLVPMRSVPHRVVCLLGLDDDAFPRRTERDGDDLVAADPFVGDGDGRSEDRQLLLDAVLAATERLVITYRGRDERTNAVLAPAVPVGELLDAIDAAVVTDDPRVPARRRVVIEHPLQPFDVKNFVPGVLGAPTPWSFDRITLRGARATQRPRSPREPFLAAALEPPAPTPVIELDQLVRFVQHPVRAFLRQRLGLSLGDFIDDVSDAMPVELDGLEAWRVGERVLGDRLRGIPPEACEAAERARGELPPDGLFPSVYDKIAKNVECLVAETEKVVGLGGDVDSLDVVIPLHDGRSIVGTVAGVVGDAVRTVTYSKLRAKSRAEAWVRFLALSAGRPTSRYRVVTIGRSTARGANTTISTFLPFDDPGLARRALHDLVALYDRGMCEPLPIACATSAAWAEAARHGKDPLGAATHAWSVDDFYREDKEAEHVLVHGGQITLDELLAQPLCDGEDGDGWRAEERTRFGRYARRLWDGLLEAEQLEHRK